MYLNPGTPWVGATVAVLGSGPTMSRKVADSVKHLPRIALNTTHKLAVDADYIYGGDALWWQRHLEVFDCAGWKVSMETRSRTWPNVPERVEVMRWGGQNGFDDRPGYLRSGGSSGYQALHLAASMGAKRILLFGFDCHGGHWHGDHPNPLGNPMESTYAGWIRAFNALAPLLAERGVEVTNCTPGSKLECFPALELAA
jgi:hypothetical protein